jgi:NMD protein affecting ribosome stability and mRNA decay
MRKKMCTSCFVTKVPSEFPKVGDVMVCKKCGVLIRKDLRWKKMRAQRLEKKNRLRAGLPMRPKILKMYADSRFVWIETQTSEE